MTKCSSNLYSLWVIAIWTEQNQKIIKTILEELSPINLLIAFWTETIQFFIQITYRIETKHLDCISRAHEFALVYLTRSDIVTLLFTATSSFDKTSINNIIVKIKSHLEHDHKLDEVKLYWQNDSVKVLSNARYLLEILLTCLPFIIKTQHNERTTLKWESQLNLNYKCVDFEKQL